LCAADLLRDSDLHVFLLESDPLEDSVKRLRIWPWRFRFSALLGLIVLCSPGSNLNSSTQAQVATPTSAPVQTLSSQGQAWLSETISSGRLPDLRWPDFSDYREHVKKFYELNGNSLWWVQGMAPNPQAQQVITLMLQAEQKGLSSDDYDGPRWNNRLAKLKPATSQPSEADAAEFDLALTVCAMRYISDLHIGTLLFCYR
jgi:hypothetical protein